MSDITNNHSHQSDLATLQLELGSFPPMINYRQPFDPVIHELDVTFRLMSFADPKGRETCPPLEFYWKLTDFVQNDPPEDETEQNHILNLHSAPIAAGFGASVNHLRHAGLCMLQSNRLMYPVVDDPYLFGRISCANALNDLYALGVTLCESMLMMMCIPFKMTPREREIVLPMIVKGFQEMANEARVRVTGGQTITNPWMMMGGSTVTVCPPNECIIPNSAMVGDVLVLTKPLGTMVAVNVMNWLNVPDRWSRIKLAVTEDDVRKAHCRAIDSMVRLNAVAARLMHKYNAHCATYVSSYGLLGHAQMMVRQQTNEVAFTIHNLPIICKMAAVSKVCGHVFQLMQGTSPEFNGGLLIALPREQAAAFCKDIERQEGYQAWIIGIVERGPRSARVIEKPRVIEVPAKDKDGELW